MLFIYTVSVEIVEMYAMLRMCDLDLTRDPYQSVSNKRRNETDGSLNNIFCNLRVVGAF